MDLCIYVDTPPQTHPGVLGLLQLQHPMSPGEVVHLLEGLDLPHEGPGGRVLPRAVLRRLLLLPTGCHYRTGQSDR